ncbi:hypothetical protein SKC37_01995 [Aquirufa sp. HETE-83D]|uniref:Uncharacterized protein n=1 Tax=Aquirufa esocilacus TaxID=3096513 RepID=A0ABW6DIB3_9BACT
MKISIRVIKFILLASIIYSCNAQENKIHEHYADEAFFILDTTCNNVDINNKKFNISIQRDRYNERMQPYSVVDSIDGTNSILYSPVTMVFRGQDNLIQLVQKYDFYPTKLYKGVSQDLSKSGRLYLVRSESANNAWVLRTHYLVFIDEGEIRIREIFKSGTLSFVAYNKNDNEILILNSVWGGGETAFEKHRQEIVKYRFDKSNSLSSQNIGITKFKYGNEMTDMTASQVLNQIKRKEPYLFRNINLDEYIQE